MAGSESGLSGVIAGLKKLLHKVRFLDYMESFKKLRQNANYLMETAKHSGSLLLMARGGLGGQKTPKTC